MSSSPVPLEDREQLAAYVEEKKRQETEALEAKVLERLRLVKQAGKLPAPKDSARIPRVNELHPVLERFLRGLRDVADKNAAASGDVAAARAKAEAAAKVELQESLRPHLKACGCPPMVADDIETIGAEKLGQHPGIGAAVRALDGFFRARETFAFLYGGPGAGKTVAACSVFLQRKARHFRSYHPLGDPLELWLYDSDGCQFVDAVDVSWCRPYTDEGARLLERWCRAPFLVLDDLGAESAPDPNGKLLEKVQGLINRRHAHCLKTVITTNLDPKTFAERYGGRIASRLAQEALLVGFGNVDLRRRS